MQMRANSEYSSGGVLPKLLTCPDYTTLLFLRLTYVLWLCRARSDVSLRSRVTWRYIVNQFAGVNLSAGLARLRALL